MSKAKQQRLIKRLWSKVIYDIVFLAISTFSGSDPSANLMAEQEELFYRLIKERIRLVK